MRALIVDDSNIARKVMSGVLLQECGFEEVLEASDGKEAMDILQSNRFQLILLDWNMPNMNGIEVLQNLREMGRKTPVIMISGESDKSCILDAFGAGANNYIVKPVTTELVAKKVHETLDRTLKAPEKVRSLRGLVADDSGVSRHLLAGTLKNNCGFGEILEAEDGAEAVEKAGDGDLDVVLLDWNMPNMTGIDALRAIREFDKTTPVVMVTSEKEGARVVEAFDAGANNYIFKPFEPSAVAHKIDQVLADHF